MTQEIINIGATINDGTGESLRNAFEAVNNNFAQVWSAGPVDSQVTIVNNRISTNETNLDLVIAGNGVGNVSAASAFVPNIAGVYGLGSANRPWSEVHGTYYYGNGAFLTGITGGGGGTQGVQGITGSQGRTGAQGTQGLQGLTGNGLDNTQITITDNRISTNQTNLDLVLAANGVGNVAVFSTMVPAIAGVFDLGSANRPWEEVHGSYFYGNGRFLTGISGGTANGTAIANGTSNVSVVSANGNVTVGVNGTGNVTEFADTAVTVGVDLLPAANLLYSLGSSSQRWQNLYLGNSIVLGAGQILGNATAISFVAPSGNLTTVSDQGLSASGNITAQAFFLANGQPIVSGAQGTQGIQGTAGTQGTKGAQGTVGAQGTKGAQGTTGIQGLTGTQGALGTQGTQGATGGLVVQGANTGVLFNDSSSANSTLGFTFDKSSNAVSVSGQVSALGNVQGNYLLGNGSAISNVLADRGGDSPNWNTITEMGVYTVNRVSWSGTSGTPLDSQVFVGMLEVKNSTGTALEQIFYPGTVESGNVKIQWNRTYWAGSWSSWYKVVNDDQVVSGGLY